MTRPLTLTLSFLACSLLALEAKAGYPMVPDALDPQACNGQGCWTNHMRVTDIDGDGSLDIVLANYNDFFQGGDDPEPLVIYTNDGAGNFTNVSAAALGNYSGNHHQIAIGDVDGDGSLDIYAPDASGGVHALFINDGAGEFTNEADGRLPPAGEVRGGAARLGDVDNDGDLDIFVSDAYASNGPPFGHIWLNDGSGVFDELADAIPTSLDGDDIDDLEFFDADRDFDLDLVINPHSGNPALWLNDGSGMFAAGGSISPVGPGSNFHYNVAACDVDGDNDLDLWIDNTGGNYTEQLLINDGNANFTDMTNMQVSGNPAGSDDNGVVCVDIDDDGDFDGVVLALDSPERLLRNDGSGNFTYEAGYFPGPTDCTLWGEFGDLNGDARLDLVTSQGECSSSDEVYLADDQEAVDSMPPRILADEAPDVGGGPIRFAVSDNTVSDEGPRLNRAFVRIDPDGAASENAAMFMGGDLFRVVMPAVPPEGEVSYQLCAEDLAGNVGCTDTQTYGGGGGTTTGDETGNETTGESGGETSGETGSGTSGETGGNDEVDGTGDTAGAGDEGGCACSTSDAGGSLGWALLGLLGLGVVRRRRPQ